jgi:sugar diacid utilization regulator
MQAVDLVATQAAEAYAREEARVRMQSGRAERDLIERLIGGYAPKERRRHPAAPGLDPTGQLTVVVGRIEQAATPVADALQVAREILEKAMSVGRARPLITIRQGEIVLITPAGAPARRAASIRAARQQARNDRQMDVRYGVSGPASGFPGVASAYREATLSLSYSSEVRPVVALGDLSSLECALISSDATVKAMIMSKAGGLTALPSGELAMVKATVRAFAASDLNVNRAATALFVHANTVRYRLGRITETTGYDPRTFAGLLELVCVIDTIEDGQVDRNGHAAAPL